MTTPPPLVQSRPLGDKGIVPDSGYFGTGWTPQQRIDVPAGQYNWPIPTAFSNADLFRDIVQQTFLGASIRSFSMNGGFGDNSSTLSVELVNDEFNKSDSTGLGLGDDPYHNGQNDFFAPPVVGSPVFFKFGPKLASIQDSYMKVFDSMYGTTATADNNPGRNHLTFGGILQSYVQNKGVGGNPIFSVQVVDPREILSNVVLILNNYSGTTFNHPNMLNIYGFLEYNASDSCVNTVKATFGATKSVLTKSVSSNGSISFSGNDTYNNNSNNPNNYTSFPITGTGFSRRGPQGIPYYRIKQSVNALMGYYGALPEEYKSKGFGGPINFRGHNYIVDFGSLPELPDFYFLDFDQLNLLELALEICDITSRDLFVTLLPVINHPACSRIFAWNTANQNDPNKFISGIIRLDATDRSRQPNYGAIKYYIDSLAYYGIYTQNQDIGFELSNIITDKFIAGAQEVDVHFFSSNADRNRYSTEDIGDQWLLDASFKQQILPYYGLLGNNAVTIPKGYGAYQQILLDATSLNANGVGSYYVATEMELRCALVSYDRWKEFLSMYNDIYMESVESDDASDSAGLLQSPAPADFPPVNSISENYAVTVPRSVFTTYASTPFGDDSLPKSPCNPPYGYPLYYKRMTKIGIPEGGLVQIQSRFTNILTGIASLKSADKSNYKHIINAEINNLKEITSQGKELNPFETKYLSLLEQILKQLEDQPDDTTINQTINIMQNIASNLTPMFYSPDLSKLAKKNTENALRVYNFVKGIAEECLGKKFLVKMPKVPNPKFQTEIATTRTGPSLTYTAGPFGFKPRAISSILGAEFGRDTDYIADLANFRSQQSSTDLIPFYLTTNTNQASRITGAIKANLNPISDQYEFNYYPLNNGGFFDFDLYANVVSAQDLSSLAHSNVPSGVQKQLIPIDLTNFLTEDGRVSCYVRFDHSENLSFDGFSPSDFVQQSITSNGMIPDISYTLDNTGKDTTFDLDNRNVSNNETPTPQIAFIKCTVDEKFYMPPKTAIKELLVFGSTPIATRTLIPPRKIYVPCDDEYVDSFSYYVNHFHPGTSSSGPVNRLDFEDAAPIALASSNIALDGTLIKTKIEDLDSNHIYALITLPGRVIPTKDSLLRDGPFQSCNAEKFKHYMLMDTVKGLSEFNSPATLNRPPKNILKIFPEQTILPDARIHAWVSAKKANDSLISFGLPQKINYAVPSPVYPDLVAIPLLSKERSYGPWVSSQLDSQAALYTNIGGKIEFVKDENLSPWNYGGYSLMNLAGRTQAEFANSLMLFSERGGFVLPCAPVGASLGGALLDSGPLVTNIQVDVSEAGISTTYKLDLYTASFGKLQRQKQDEISKISRERQKLRDERNALIRKGIGKNQTQTNYLKQYEALEQKVNHNIAGALANNENSAGSSSAPSVIALSATRFDERRYSMSQGQEHTVSNYPVEGSITSNQAIGNVMQSFLGEDGLASAYMNTAVSNISDIFAPASNDPSHPNMASRPTPLLSANRSFYFDENTPFTEEDVI